MPTLQRRQDGAYFIRNYYHDHHTWQLIADGLRFLELRGITEGSFFSTDLFMQLYLRGWIFTGTGARLPIRGNAVSELVPPELDARLQRFHQHLFKGDVDDLIAMLWWGPAIDDAATANGQVRDQLAKPDARVKSWKLRDATVHDLSEELRSSVGGGDSLAVVRVRLATSSTPLEVTEHWIRVDGEWRVAWGFLS